MSNTKLIDHLSVQTGRSPEDIRNLLNGLSKIITGHLAALDNVALPGFGEFSAIKEEERVTTDLSTGRQMLLPPAITVNFTPSAILRRKMNEIK